jgi:hypothetical protein
MTFQGIGKLTPIVCWSSGDLGLMASGFDKGTSYNYWSGSP